MAVVRRDRHGRLVVGAATTPPHPPTGAHRRRRSSREIAIAIRNSPTSRHRHARLGRAATRVPSALIKTNSRTVDGAEHAAAKKRGAAAEQINVQEQEAIQQEIKRGEERFGSEGLSRHGDVYNNDPEDLYERSLAQ